ncbi:glycosyltransferase [Oscillatoriales cyanobacterium USR001]|nr:glycosyltransferase [Oscillatoriales cyanobacterium USR001]
MKFRISKITDLLKYQGKRKILVLVLSLLWLLALSWLGFLWNLGSVGLVDETEPLFAEAARQMTVTGDWITPYFNGQTRFDKPPLIYWLMAIAYHAIGVNSLAVRLPSALAAIALTCLGFYTINYCTQPETIKNSEQEFSYLTEDKPTNNRPFSLISLYTAWMGSALIALNPETLAWGRTGVSDMLLTGCMCSALFAFFIGYVKEEENRKNREEIEKEKVKNLPLSPWYLAFYILIALAILAKGPIGIVLPVIIIVSFTLYLGNSREIWQEMRPQIGILIILVIALPWFILVTLANGQDYINSFFGYHNFQRFTQVVNRHAAPWYFYFLVVLVGFAPWSIYLPGAIAHLKFWQRRYWCRQPRKAQLGLFALFWFVCIFGFFTVAVTKLPSYVLPLMPAAAILVTLLWSKIISIKKAEIGINQKSFPLYITISFIVNVIFLLVLAGVIFYSFNWLGKDPAMPNFDRIFRESGLGVTGGWLWIITAAMVTMLIWLRQESGILTVNLIGLAAFIIFVITPVYNLVDEHRQLPLRQLANTAVQEKLPGEELIMVGFPKPSLVFYTQQPVTYYRMEKDVIKYIQTSQNKAPASVLILGQPKKFTQMSLQPNQYQILDDKGAYQLLRVPKQAFKNIDLKSR